MTHCPKLLQSALFLIIVFLCTPSQAQIRRKPITPDLSNQGIPNSTKTETKIDNSNTPPASLPPIIIKQDEGNKEVIIRKADKGDFTVEGVLQLSLGGSEPIMLKFPEIKGRYFTNQTLAYRGTLGFDIGSQTNDITDNRNMASYTISTQNIRAGGGVEIHVKASKRFSPYYGGEGLILLQSYKITSVNTDDLKTYSLGAGYQKDSTFSGVYLGGLAGLDYYLNSDVYIGFELGLGVTSFSSTLVGERKTMRGVTTSESNVINGRGNRLDIRYTPGIRVGFKF
jgi:hypothetical protein